MLQNELYNIEVLGEASAELLFLPQSMIYTAHFPGKPITPGVCFVQIVQEILSQIKGRKVVIPYVHSLKLLHYHTPDKQLSLKIDETGTRTKAFFFNQETEFVSLTFEYTEA